jgi:DNA gyrase subunit B
MPFPQEPPALADCRRHGPGSGAELFIVEGDSAAAAVGRVRDPEFQAVLPMQGKPLNAAKASPRRVAAHGFYTLVAESLGAGPIGGAAPDPSRLRFGRVLLLMDPDADGIHCGVLLLQFFHRWLPQLLGRRAAAADAAGGMVEVVRPPWGEVAFAGESHPRLAFSEEEFHGLSSGARPRTAVRRFRGLAGLDAGLLRTTCVAPATRRTDRVTADDVTAMLTLLAAIEPES